MRNRETVELTPKAAHAPKVGPHPIEPELLTQHVSLRERLIHLFLPGEEGLRIPKRIRRLSQIRFCLGTPGPPETAA